MQLFYLLPGIAMVIHQGPVTFTHPRSGIARISLVVLTPGEAHPFGAIAIVIAIIFLVTFLVGKQIRNEESQRSDFLDI